MLILRYEFVLYHTGFHLNKYMQKVLGYSADQAESMGGKTASVEKSTELTLLD